MRKEQVERLVEQLNEIEDREERLMAFKDICKEISAGADLDNRQDVYLKRYRDNHPEANGIHVKAWRNKNSGKYKQYMRDYMRKRRKAITGGDDTEGTGKTL